VVVFRFYYSVFSTYNFDINQFGYQRELVSFCAYCAPKAHAPLAQKLSAPQLSAGPLASTQGAIHENHDHSLFYTYFYIYNIFLFTGQNQIFFLSVN
jgi:hypothetical protein